MNILTASDLPTLAYLIGILIVSYLILRSVVFPIIKRGASRTSTYIDDLFLDKKFLNRKPKFLTFSFKTSEHYLNIHFWWVGNIIKTINNVELGRARLALASLKKFIGDIDVEFPNLENENINKIYF